MFDDVAIVAVSGELDVALCIKLAPDIDLEAVSLVDSSGIALLLNAYRHLDHAGRQLAIACPMGSPRRGLELTGLDRHLPMHETRHDALAAVGAG